MPINFLALDYISIRNDEIQDMQANFSTNETNSLSKFKENFEDNFKICDKKQKKSATNLEIKDHNCYESKTWNNNDKAPKLNEEKPDIMEYQAYDNFENCFDTEMENSEEFNENEFNEWLMMNNQNDQYLNSSENEEFDKFISGTYFVENNSNEDKNLDNSPSYSPLEDINSQCPFSQVIELDKQLEKRLKTGIDKIHSITIENLENLHIKDNKIEIVVDSDDESPWSKMSHFEIVNDYLENLKLKISTPQSLEILDQVCEQKRKTDETFNEDYLYRFSESLELVKKMLDIIEKSEADELNSKCEQQLNLSSNSKDNPIAKGSNLLSIDTEDNLKQNFEAKRCCYVPSSITITKLRKKISFKILESFTCLSIKNNEKFIKMNYDQIEKIFVKLISNCIEQVEINCEVNDINFDLVKKMAEKNTSKLFFPWYLLLQFCFKSLDLLFNCSWSDFLQYMKSFLNDYQYLPEIKNSLELVFNEIEKTITGSGQIFNEIQSPKVMILFEYIQKESEKFKDVKFLVLVPRKSNELFSSLLCQMRSLTHIKTCIFHTDSHYTLSDFENLKSNNDCLIVDYHTSLFDKLSEFTHLIMYEQLGETGSVKNNLELCAKLNIKYVEFEKYNINFFDKIEHNLTENDKIRTVICSERVANNTFLVELIEIEQGIKLVTRNYEYIAAENNLNNSFICNADILVNEKVGIVFQECSHFMNYFEDEINLFFTKIVNFRLSLVNLFVIFTFSDTIESNFNFVSNQNYIRFLKFCKDLNGNSSNFKLGPLFLGDFEKLRILLKKIFENFQSSSKNLNFTNEPTLEEIFLVSLGCFNSFNAQLILQSCSVTDLISMNFNDFKTKFKFMDDEKIDFFFKISEFGEN